MRNIPNQDTLAAALELVVTEVIAGRYPFKDLEGFYSDWCYSGGINYGEHRTRTYELETGKPRAKKFLSLTITRLDSGRYETVAYLC